MQLQNIDLRNLKTTKLNVRKKGRKDIADLLPSIRAQGLLQPLLVRPNCDGYEVIAGQRRLFALQELAKEDDGIADIPCLVMEAGDDAAAIEASLAENIARLPMDEIDQYKAFEALIKQGLDVEDIAQRFGITERLVRQRLAIANLIPPLLNAYRRDEVDGRTLRILTMATKSQQKDWWTLHQSDDAYAPEGYTLRSWLFGGAQISTDAALFDVAAYDGALVSDLFGEDVYFDDSAKFWELQNTAIAALRQSYLDDGWQDVVLLDIGEQWNAWEHADIAKEDGGKVYIRPSRNGEVTCHEGLLPRKEAERRLSKQAGEKEPAPAKPELTKAMQNYLDMHRQTAVRMALLDHGDIALRLAVAQIVAGSPLWQINADPQKADREEIAASLKSSKAGERFQEARQKIAAMLGIELEADQTLVPRKDDWGVCHDLHVVFPRLLAMDDAQVLEVLAFTVAETLTRHEGLVDVLGKLLDVKMAETWEPDETFVTLLRDKETINAMLREIGGKAVADGNVTATAKAQKAVLSSFLKGERKPVRDNWLPRYMRFPMTAYTKRGGIRAVETWKELRKLYA